MSLTPTSAQPLRLSHAYQLVGESTHAHSHTAHIHHVHHTVHPKCHVLFLLSSSLSMRNPHFPKALSRLRAPLYALFFSTLRFYYSSILVFVNYF